jgi:hypothetical protein
MLRPGRWFPRQVFVHGQSSERYRKKGDWHFNAFWSPACRAYGPEEHLRHFHAVGRSCMTPTESETLRRQIETHLNEKKESLCGRKH